MIELTVAGRPTGKGRPRFNPRTGHARTDDATRLGEARVIEAWMNAGSQRLSDGPVHLTVEVVVARPKSHYRVDGTLTAAGARSLVPLRKPDLDNAIKLIMDALNGCACRDDVDVVSISAWRRWCRAGEHEHTHVTVAPTGAELRKAG